MVKSLKNFEQYLLLIFILFPILLISGPLLTDLTAILFSIFFLIRYKHFNFNARIRNFIILVCLFYFLINISSLLSDNILLSLKSSLVYFRFIFFSFVVAILIPYVEKNQNISKYFNFFFQFIFIFFFIDSFYQFFNNQNLLGMKITSNLNAERVSSSAVQFGYPACWRNSC